MTLQYRRADMDDVQLLFDLVNSPDSLAGKLLTKSAIRWDSHRAWLQKRCLSDDALILIAEEASDPVGQVRLQENGDSFLDVDIYVLPGFRGRGFARRMILEAAGRAQRRWPGRSLRAVVRAGNEVSMALFRSAGFRCDDVQTEYSTFIASTAEVSPMRFEKSLEMYERALRTVPLASQTFSKSAQNFVFGASPLFLERGRGAHVWDVDGNAYIDYIGGLLPVVLGYCDPDVDAAIVDQMQRGISFSLATSLEVEVAELLVRLIPSAEMVRFGKNGSDATSAAIRLARACTGRDRVIACGYHGWHDWYIGSTARDLGVPDAVKALTATVPFNDLAALDAILKANPDGYAALIMEPAGVQAPVPGYLEGVRRLTEHYGVVLVFDEIVTGFRINLGGAQAEYGVTPDLSCFGKAMGNGMPISAIVGRRDLMKRMEDIFFSGTFGGEALSLAAAKACMEKLERMQVPARLKALGARLQGSIRQMLIQQGIDNLLTVGGPDFWPRINVAPSTDAVLINSLLRQEAVAHGLLMGGAFNLSLSHDDDGIVSDTLEAFSNVVRTVGEAMALPDPSAALRGDPIRPVFQVRKS
jgi:glutamate-1-semialdehyde 2,1-aminomutase